MEVCGGHTHAIFKYGLNDLFPPQLTALHGPGCPVCVTPMGKIDQAIALARRPNVTLVSYGDMLRVPGSQSSLLEEKARGADVRIVYSPLDALRIAREKPDREVVFFAIGFETTAPANAMALLRAHRQGITNFSLVSNHVLVAPAMKAVLDAPDVHIDGFVGPGHVSTIIGTRPYEFIVRDYGLPVVVSGFEPVDLLQSFLMVLRQARDGRAELENQYARSVRQGRQPTALAVLEDVFEPVRPGVARVGLDSASAACESARVTPTTTLNDDFGDVTTTSGRRPSGLYLRRRAPRRTTTA